MADGLGATLRRFIFWDFPRASWQYDVMVGLILAFIFLTPRSMFRDQPRPKNVILVSAEASGATYFIEPEVLGSLAPAEREAAAGKAIRAQAGGKNLRVKRLEPIYDHEKEIRGYLAYTHQ